MSAHAMEVQLLAQDLNWNEVEPLFRRVSLPDSG